MRTAAEIAASVLAIVLITVGCGRSLDQSDSSSAAGIDETSVVPSTSAVGAPSDAPDTNVAAPYDAPDTNVGAGSASEQATSVAADTTDVPSTSAAVGPSDYREERLRMVRRQIEASGIEDAAVLEAMRTVPRHRFVADGQVRQAYADRPLPIGHGQTISQPYIVAYLTELVLPDSSDRVLEVGTGSGYQAAVLAEVVDAVYTVEIIPDLARTAERRLDELGYDDIYVRSADGYHGWMEHAPFDAVVVTAAAEHIPPPLIEQLAEGGRMVIPVGSPFRTQNLMLVEKNGDEVSTRSITPVRFVPFTRAE